MTSDPVLESFLIHQRRAGMALAAASDLLDLEPLGDPAPDRYIADFSSRGLMRDPGGRIVESNRFTVGIWFPPDYLRRADTFTVATVLRPRTCWHPNISARTPHICLGFLTPGTELVSILYQLYEIYTWNKVKMDENDALNSAACAWARRNQHRFPIDRRPLKRSTVAPAGEVLP
jgi:hypothetical protein